MTPSRIIAIVRHRASHQTGHTHREITNCATPSRPAPRRVGWPRRRRPVRGPRTSVDVDANCGAPVAKDDPAGVGGRATRMPATGPGRLWGDLPFRYGEEAAWQREVLPPRSWPLRAGLSDEVPRKGEGVAALATGVLSAGLLRAAKQLDLGICGRDAVSRRWRRLDCVLPPWPRRALDRCGRRGCPNRPLRRERRFPRCTSPGQRGLLRPAVRQRRIRRPAVRRRAPQRGPSPGRSWRTPHHRNGTQRRVPGRTEEWPRRLRGRRRRRDGRACR